MTLPKFGAADLAALAVGGAGGASLRWIVSSLIDAPTTSIPWGTLCANLIGTLVLGAVTTCRHSITGHTRLWLALGTGFCGGATTFSSLAVELAQRLRGLGPFTDTGGDPSQFGLYLALSVCGGAVAFIAGRRLADWRLS